jgi:YidC/Oxa1 family membrane protein insertase
MFETFVERPVFNLLEFIYAVVPGHDLGIAIILFTVVIRLLLWPLVKKQLHQSRAMRKLQPELKKIKKKAGGDKQKQARLQMELYKEYGVKPFSTIGTLIVQLPIFIALFFSIRKLIEDPNTLQTFSYDWVRDLSWIQTLADDISQFQHTLLGLVDLSRSGIGDGTIYLPAIILAGVAAFTQYHQSKMLMPDSKDARRLRDILKDAGSGKEADQSEVSAAMSRNMIFFLPFLTFGFASYVPSALALYFLATSAFGWIQQKIILGKDVEEMTQIAGEPETAEAKERKAKKAEIVPTQSAKKKPSTAKKRKKASRKKRRK